MGTEDDAVKYVIEHKIPIAKLSFGVEHEFRDDLTEDWEGGWILFLVPVDGKRFYKRYLIEKELEKCVSIGSPGVNRAIDDCYGYRPVDNWPPENKANGSEKE